MIKLTTKEYKELVEGAVKLKIVSEFLEKQEDNYVNAKEAEEQALEENQRWHISEVNPSIKNVFANMSTQICHNCDHKDEYIEELEAEIQQYRAISTVEECRAAVEKQTAKKVISFEYHNGTINYGCPVCKWKIISKINGEWCCGTFNEYCDRCGQKLDWSDEDEKI